MSGKRRIWAVSLSLERTYPTSTTEVRGRNEKALADEGGVGVNFGRTGGVTY